MVQTERGGESASAPALFEYATCCSPKIQESKPTGGRGDNLTRREGERRSREAASARVAGALARRCAVARLARAERLDRGAEPGHREPLALGRTAAAAAAERPAIELLRLRCGALELRRREDGGVVRGAKRGLHRLHAAREELAPAPRRRRLGRRRRGGRRRLRLRRALLPLVSLVGGDGDGGWAPEGRRLLRVVCEHLFGACCLRRV